MECRYKVFEFGKKPGWELGSRSRVSGGGGGGKFQEAAVNGVGKIIEEASADYIKEHKDASVDDEKLFDLGVF